MLRSPPASSNGIVVDTNSLPDFRRVMTWTADGKKQVRSRLSGLAEAYCFESALVQTTFAAAGTVTLGR